MDRSLVRFLRRKSLTAQCILHVVEQHFRMEPERVNREDYATDEKCQLSSVSLAASGFLGPELFSSSASCGWWQELLHQGLINPAPHQWLCVYLPWSNRIWFAPSLVLAMLKYDRSLAPFCAVYLPLVQLRTQLNTLLRLAGYRATIHAFQPLDLVMRQQFFQAWAPKTIWYHMMVEWYDMIYDIFLNCNWVVTRWQ